MTASIVKNKTISSQYDDAILQFSPEAFVKMYALIDNFSTEVAWHGLCYRDTVQSNRFIIYDILVYPQEVTGCTVTPGQKEYEDWLYDDLTDVEFADLKMHGHSHVNFSPSPSGTDTEYQKGKLKDVCDDDFYIFIICNKDMCSWVRIYDKANNVLYHTSDIDIVISSVDCDIEDFLNKAHKKVRMRCNENREDVVSDDGSFEKL
jgi:hypothetical protein